ncbi:phage baseplate assembly protein [Treponema denticola]|uniref:hypothetical protein n=1 Tax=Treponema denticola TaxID=158 RepID=UPI00204948F2|nr:MAG TPA: hypothetical protein [Caudoviricetes sp.]
MGLSDIYARLRNILNTASFKKREDKTVTVESDFSRTIEAEEFFPYGFFSKAKKGRAVILNQGGNAGSYILLPVSSIEGVPDLNDGDAVLWSEDGGKVIVRADKTVELNGTDFGGLVKIEELKKELAKMSARIDGIISAVKTAAVVPQDGGAAFKANMIGFLETLVNKENFTQIENKKVQHGQG